jgi:hypothetical protein
MNTDKNKTNSFICVLQPSSVVPVLALFKNPEATIHPFPFATQLSRRSVHEPA